MTDKKLFDNKKIVPKKRTNLVLLKISQHSSLILISKFIKLLFSLVSKRIIPIKHNKLSSEFYFPAKKMIVEVFTKGTSHIIYSSRFHYHFTYYKNFLYFLILKNNVRYPIIYYKSIYMCL